jgi:hypothetical protein
MAKARPLRKTGRKTGGKSVKERQLSSAEAKPADRAPTTKTVPLRPARKPVVGVPERQMAVPEVAPPLPAPIASFTF